MAKKTNMGPVINVPLDSLVPFPVNPFGLYTGQRLDDMIESIQANGVLVPIIVRPLGDGTYEILSGHNRVEASRLAALQTIPAVVRDDLNDEEALLVLTETNLLQRSLADLTHSERAVALSVHYEAMKSQGRRSDLIEEVEAMLQDGVGSMFSTSGPVGQKLGARKRISLEQGLSERHVARYLRVSRLIKPHQNRLDSGAISLRTAVSLSYLSAGEQELVDEVLASGRHKLSLAEANALRNEKKPLTREAVLHIVKDAGRDAMRTLALRLDPLLLSRYFKPDQSLDEIETTIAKALELYFRAK